MKRILNESAYTKALAQVDKLMAKGEKGVTEKDVKFIEETTRAIRAYEAVHYPFPFPKTLAEMVELKMLEKKLNRANLAKMLGIGAPKLSQILNLKREPDVPFLKALHKKLGVDGNFILEKV